MVQTGTRYVLAYTLWVVSVALAIMVLLSWRSSAMIILGVTPWDRYLEHALNQFGFLFLAIIGLCVIVFAEHYYRTGVEKERLFIRFFFITFIELIFLTGAHLARLIGSVILEISITGTWQVVLVEFILCILAYILFRRAIANYVEPELS